MPSATSRQQILWGLIEPAVAALGCDLEDLAISQAGRRTVIRVIVDRDGGIDLDAVAEASRAVSATLDDAEQDVGGAAAAGLSGPYVLEVSSPGVDRPLSAPRHWRRNVGRLVTGTAAGAAFTGRIMAVDEGGATVDVRGRTRTVPFEQLGPAKVQVEFGRPDADELDDDQLDDDQVDDDELDDDELDDDQLDADEPDGAVAPRDEE